MNTDLHQNVLFYVAPPLGFWPRACPVGALGSYRTGQDMFVVTSSCTVICTAIEYLFILQPVFFFLFRIKGMKVRQTRVILLYS